MRTRATCVPGPPRKLIWLPGDASLLPGSGETVTGFAAAALTSARAVAPEPASDAPSLEEESPPPEIANTSAPAISTQTAPAAATRPRRVTGRARCVRRLTPTRIVIEPAASEASARHRLTENTTAPTPAR